MSAAQLDLARLLEQSLTLVDEILELSRKLVLEVKAEHYWTRYSLDAMSQLRNISRNLAKMLDRTEDNWDQGEKLFATEDGMKLWRTAAGLLRALPKVRSKYVEQLARRRRQRIMGQELEEVEELDPKKLAEEEEQFRRDQGELRTAREALLIMMERLPEGLSPTAEQLEALKGGRLAAPAPSKDEQPAEAPPGEAPPTLAVDQASSAEGGEASATEPDETSPV